MKINFEGFELEYIRTEFMHEIPDFYFEHEGIHLVLYYRTGFGWRICIGNRIKNNDLRSTDFYKFLRQDHEKQKKIGKKMIEYLFKKSPMRTKLLFEFGHDFLAKTNMSQQEFS